MDRGKTRVTTHEAAGATRYVMGVWLKLGLANLIPRGWTLSLI